MLLNNIKENKRVANETFLSEFEGEIIDMKYQVAISVYREEQIFCFSCMIIYN